MQTLISFIILLGVIVFIHELGHYLAAKLCGMKVEIFSLGFGKALFKKQRGETEYRIAWIPLGGYVKIAGMMDESMDTEGVSGGPDEFESKNFFQKSFVILAGVMMNFMLAVFIYSAITFFTGIPEVTSTVVKGFGENSPAKAAGMKEEDIITEIDGRIINSWSDLSEYIHAKPGEKISVGVSRNDSLLFFDIVTEPAKTLIDGEIRTVGLIGIYSDYTIRDAGFFESVGQGFAATWGWLKIGWLSVKMLVTGEASIKDLGGPIFIAKMTGESVKAGFWTYLGFIAFISINVGFLNAMPIPLLDGGHFMFIVTEAVIRRKIPLNIKFRILQTGMILLFILMMIILYNDTRRVITGEDLLDQQNGEEIEVSP